VNLLLSIRRIMELSGFSVGAAVVFASVIPYVLMRKLRLRPPKRVLISGYASPGFENVTRVFRESIRAGREPVGAHFAVWRKGKLVVDLQGGYADKGAEIPWRTNTLSSVFSTGKGVAAIVVAMLVDR
jgi:CubicO group peptidase (beta-lactamase class C family)